MIADATTTLDVTGDVRINNDASFGRRRARTAAASRCGRTGPGSVTFGRQVKVNGYFCAPERLVRLGHDNDLTGRFFGDVGRRRRQQPRVLLPAATTSRRPATCEVPDGPNEPLRRGSTSYFVARAAEPPHEGHDARLAVQRRRQLRVGHDERHCGVLAMADATFGTGSQVVGDKVFIRKAGARLWQLFRNDGGSLDDTELLAPPEHPVRDADDPGDVRRRLPAGRDDARGRVRVPRRVPRVRQARPVRAIRTRTASSTRCRATASATSRRERTAGCAS